jgi:hypothetical protein
MQFQKLEALPQVSNSGFQPLHSRKIAVTTQKNKLNPNHPIRIRPFSRTTPRRFRQPSMQNADGKESLRHNATTKSNDDEPQNTGQPNHRHTQTESSSDLPPNRPEIAPAFHHRTQLQHPKKTP